jgi:uncharacterized protein (TIGR02284 family)
MPTGADEAVVKDLIETLEDGKQGFARGAEHLDGSSASDTAQTFRRFADQRAEFSAELRSFATTDGEQVGESGSVGGALHRGWMSLKDALSGSDPGAVIDAAETGEDHAVKAYETALKEDMSPALRVIIERQYAEIKAAHDQVSALAHANS